MLLKISYFRLYRRQYEIKMKSWMILKTHNRLSDHGLLFLELLSQLEMRNLIVFVSECVSQSLYIEVVAVVVQ